MTNQPIIGGLIFLGNFRIRGEGYTASQAVGNINTQSTELKDARMVLPALDRHEKEIPGMAAVFARRR